MSPFEELEKNKDAAIQAAEFLDKHAKSQEKHNEKDAVVHVDYSKLTVHKLGGNKKRATLSHKGSS